MAYLPAQGGSLVCAKGYFGGFHGLGSYFIRRQVWEIPYTINRYESEFFKIEFLDLIAFFWSKYDPLVIKYY